MYLRVIKRIFFPTFTEPDYSLFLLFYTKTNSDMLLSAVLRLCVSLGARGLPLVSSGTKRSLPPIPILNVKILNLFYSLKSKPTKPFFHHIASIAQEIHSLCGEPPPCAGKINFITQEPHILG